MSDVMIYEVSTRYGNNPKITILITDDLCYARSILLNDVERSTGPLRSRDLQRFEDSFRHLSLGDILCCDKRMPAHYDANGRDRSWSVHECEFVVAIGGMSTLRKS